MDVAVMKVILKSAPLDKSSLWIGGVLTLIETLAVLTTPLLTKLLVDGMTEGSNPHLLALLIATLMLQAVTGAAAYDRFGRQGHRFVARLRSVLTRHCLHQPIGFHAENPAGSVTSRIMDDAESLRSLFSEHVQSLLSGILQIVGSIAILAWLDWKLTVVLFGSIAFTTLVIVPLSSRLRKLATQIQDQSAVVCNRLTTCFEEVELVKSLVCEQQQVEYIRLEIERLRNYGMQEVRWTAWVAPFISVALMGALVAILGYGGMRAESGEMATGTLVAFVLYLFNVAIPVVQITMFYLQLQRGLGGAERISRILNEEQEDLGLGLRLPPKPVSLRLDAVVFAYPGSPAKVLNGLDFEMHTGDMIALVGLSGAGKSTIFTLLERFYHPDSGQILWNGELIDDFSLQAWRQKIAYVAQDSPVFPGSIRDNLCFGLAHQPGEMELMSALKAAHADEFVSHLPRGLDTELGARGQSVSGGQRQRIALARLWLREPNLILLDEATAHLDNHSESHILSALQRMRRDCMILVATHRVTTAVSADKVAFIEHGRVAGLAPHPQLLRENASYADFLKRQQKQVGDHDSELAAESCLVRGLQER